MKNTEPNYVRRTSRDYTLGFKLAVVEQVEKGELTYKQAQRLYGIQGRSTVLVWLRKHGKLDWSKPMKPLIMSKSNETPAQKIKHLEKEVEALKEVNHVYKSMENLLIKEYGINIRKKYSSELYCKKNNEKT